MNKKSACNFERQEIFLLVNPDRAGRGRGQKIKSELRQFIRLEGGGGAAGGGGSDEAAERKMGKCIKWSNFITPRFLLINPKLVVGGGGRG